MTGPDVCIYHDDCPDGFSAAWSAKKKWPHIELIPASHGGDIPDVSGKKVLMVDFSYPKNTIETMFSSCKSLIILDHHKTAFENLKDFISENVSFDIFDGKTKPSTPMAKFDMEKSGAVLTWEFCFPNHEVPLFLKYVEDRDLWKFQMPNAREVLSLIDIYDFTLSDWNDLEKEITNDKLHEISETGKFLMKKRQKDVVDVIRHSRRQMTIGGIEIDVANSPRSLASYVASYMSKGKPFAATYYDDKNGKRVFSLRSEKDGSDVSLIAESYGGGGHAQASGFRMPIGWEGDEISCNFKP